MHNKILIAEDDIDIIELLKLYLENNGFIVDSVSDGESALERIRGEPEAVLLH